MSWHAEEKKDAAYGETPRGAASAQRSVGIRMGKPGAGMTRAILWRNT